PTLMMAKSKLEKLGYRSPAEQFGERFRASPDLLVRLNPGKNLQKEGTEIVVPNVAEVVPPGKAAYIVVDKTDLALTAYDAGDKILSHYPATIGSKRDPLPIGTWKINGVARNPIYHYNPKLFWDAEEGDRKAKIAAGPNNPVGAVWIDLSKEHYGIHGTPEPSTIGKSYSHGCIRLTNWSALELAGMVSPGVKVILQE
ncbi:MAG TPA: L,D-transpeptidase, partial [Thermoanaerobaculia bacterium]|nr:L,D-transpeptidase [Thermoanaerobaculia bacterium]